MEISEVTAFKINNVLFLTKEKAEKYKFECVDEVFLGDYINVKGWCQGPSNLFGYVCCIEEEKIWFAIGDCPPEKFLGSIKRNWKNFIVDGESYSFDIGCHPRKNLIRINTRHHYIK